MKFTYVFPKGKASQNYKQHTVPSDQEPADGQTLLSAMANSDQKPPTPGFSQLVRMASCVALGSFINMTFPRTI